MIGIRGGIDNWGGSQPSSMQWGGSRPSTTHLNSHKDNDKEKKEDILDSDLDVDLSHFDHTSAIENFSHNTNLNFSDDSPQIKQNPLAFLFNSSSEINADQQKPVNELPSSNWSFRPQESDLKQQQNATNYLIASNLNNTSPVEELSNTKINPLSKFSSEQEDKTKAINNKPSSNWLLNPKHRISQKTSSPSSHELVRNEKTQYPLEQDVNMYGNDNLNYSNESLRYNENYRSENENEHDYENNFNDNEYNNYYEEYGNHFEQEFKRGTFFHVDKYNDKHDSLRIYRKTRGQRNRESTLGQIRRSLGGSVIDSSFNENLKTSQHSLPDSNSKHFRISMTTIPPSGNSLPPMPEPDYDISDATFYIPPPDY